MFEKESDENLIKPVVGRPLGAEDLGSKTLICMLDNLALPVPGCEHETYRGLVPVKLPSTSPCVGLSIHQGLDSDNVLMALRLSQLDDLLQALQLLSEVEPLLDVEGVADQVRGARLPQLLQEPLSVGQTVYLEDGAPKLPHSQANLHRNCASFSN